MNQAVNFRRNLTGWLLLAATLNCSAMSLGRTKGAVWIGQSLDVSIQVRLESGEDASSLCATADVFHADTRVSSEQVRVSIDAGVNRDEAMVRIRSAALVDEPVVTLYLKAGCNQTMTRRYVLLAEVPLDYTVTGTAGNAALARLPLVSQSTGLASSVGNSGPGGRAAAPVFPGASDKRKTLGGRSGESSSSGSMASTNSPALEGKPPPVKSLLRNPEPVNSPGKPRLKLDPANFSVEQDLILRASSELLSVPVETGSRRAEAAALWRAINATPEAIIKDAQRLQALQADVEMLRSQSQKHEAALLELKARGDNSGALGLHAGKLVYGLLLALLGALGASVFFWNRSRVQAARRWWDEADSLPGGRSDLPSASLSSTKTTAMNADTAGAGADVDLDLDFDLSSSAADLAGLDVRRPDQSVQKGLEALDSVDFQTSIGGTGRAVKVEELFDIQQQADFFMSLGQYDQAIAILQNHIAGNAETSALAYLDLLKIFHEQGREQDYDRIRSEFNKVFNAEVPEFSEFGQHTRSLESYQSAMSRIMALWPSERVLGVIEESIFRKPGAGNHAFDPEAYRELLLLYAVAKEIVEAKGKGMGFKPSRSAPTSPMDLASQAVPELPPLKFQSTSMEPLSTAPVAVDNMDLPTLKVPPSPNLGLDIDLSELGLDFPSEPVIPVLPAPPATAAPKALDSNVLEFDLFDMATEAHIASRRGKP
jgi:tetratricopeptide (TPR) repeat protein